MNYFSTSPLGPQTPVRLDDLGVLAVQKIWKLRQDREIKQAQYQKLKRQWHDFIVDDQRLFGHLRVRRLQPETDEYARKFRDLSREVGRRASELMDIHKQISHLAEFLEAAGFDDFTEEVYDQTWGTSLGIWGSPPEQFAAFCARLRNDS